MVEGSEAPNAVETWKAIAQLTERFSGLECSGSRRALRIDSTVKPQLPSIDETRQMLLTIPAIVNNEPRVLQILEQCESLKSRVNQGYEECVSGARSLEEYTGQNDRDYQLKLSVSWQNWYTRAENQLIDGLQSKEEKRAKAIVAQPQTILLNAFALNANPNDKERYLLGTVCGYSYKQVTTWFQNRRQRVKAAQLKGRRPVSRPASQTDSKGGQHAVESSRLLPKPSSTTRSLLSDGPIRSMSDNISKSSRGPPLLSAGPTSEKIDGGRLRHLPESETRSNSLLFSEARGALSSGTRYTASHSMSENGLPAGTFGTISLSDMHLAELPDNVTAAAGAASRQSTKSHNDGMYKLDALTPFPGMQNPPSIRPLPNLTPTPAAKRPVQGLPKSKKGTGKPSRPVAKPAYVEPGSEPEPPARSASGSAPSTGHIPMRQVDYLPPAQVSPPTPPSDLYSGPSPTESRIPSLTRSVSTISESTDGSLTELSDGQYDKHHHQVSGCSEQASMFNHYGSQGVMSMPTSFERGGAYPAEHAFATPMKTAYGSAATPMTNQTYGTYSSPMDQTPTQRNFQQITYAQPQIAQIHSSPFSYPQQTSAQHQPLPPCRTMLPPNATTPQNPNIFQLMTDQNGAQFLVPVQSMVPAQYVQVPPLHVPAQPYQPPVQVPQVPMQQAEVYQQSQAQALGMWEAQKETDLRVVSYQTQLPPQPTPAPLPMAYQQTPSHSSHATPASSQRSSSMSEEEFTPSPYQTPVPNRVKTANVGMGMGMSIGAGLFTTMPMDLSSGPEKLNEAVHTAPTIENQKRGEKQVELERRNSSPVQPLQVEPSAPLIKLPELPPITLTQPPPLPLAPIPIQPPTQHTQTRTEPELISFSFTDLEQAGFGPGLDEGTLRDMQVLLGLPSPGEEKVSEEASSSSNQGVLAGSEGTSMAEQDAQGGSVEEPAIVPTSNIPQLAEPRSSINSTITPQITSPIHTTPFPITFTGSEVDTGFRYEWEWGLLPFDSIGSDQGFEI